MSRNNRSAPSLTLPRCAGEGMAGARCQFYLQSHETYPSPAGTKSVVADFDLDTQEGREGADGYLAAAFFANRSSNVVPRSIFASFSSGVNCTSMSSALFIAAASIRPVCE